MTTHTASSHTASCMDDHDPQSKTVDQARATILELTPAITEKESCPLKQSLGRILSEDLRSDMQVPEHTNAAMDGYALLGKDIPANGTVALKNIGTAFAGEPFPGTVKPGECIRIMTGAPMPQPCDTVVIQENVTVDGNKVIVSSTERASQNVRQAGEDIQQGDTILRTGKCLTPADIGLIASCGIRSVQVYRKPRIAFFSTGNELIPCGEPLSAGQIYDSNRYTLHGMLERAGVAALDLGIVRDEPETLRATFEQKLDTIDMIITSGGVSVGEKDYMHQVLARLGHIEFWKVAVKPGRPLLFGKIKHSLYFGLPGNPVSVMVVFYALVQPALRKLMGENPLSPPLMLQAHCQSHLRKRPGRTEYQRGLLTRTTQGEYQVSKTGAQGSGILTSMSRANCFIVLPVESDAIKPGELVPVIPFSGLI